jgi:hypothetical protein
VVCNFANQVHRYTFGIGLSVALFCVFTAIYAEDVAYHFKEILKKILMLLHDTTTEVEHKAREAKTKWQEQQQISETASGESSREKDALYADIYQPIRRKGRMSVMLRGDTARQQDLEGGRAG